MHSVGRVGRTASRPFVAAIVVTALIGASVAASTAATAANSAISVLSITQFGPDSSGDYEIVGELQNSGSSPLGPVRVDFSFYDASNTLLSTDYTYSSVDRLAPGEKSPFSLWFSPVASYDHYSYAVSDENFDFYGVNHNFTVAVTNRYNDGLFEHLVGTVRNDNTTKAEFVSVVGTAYAPDGTAVDEAWTFINNSSKELAPGTSATFELVFFGQRSFPTYALLAQSTSDPSTSSTSPSPSPSSSVSPSPSPSSTPTKSPTPAPTTAPAAEVTRLAGADRLGTAIAVSTDAWGAQQAQSVVLARWDAFPDALAGTPLAVAKNGPLLLTPSTSLSSNIANEIKRVLPTGRTVYLLGGTTALSQSVADAVARLGYNVARLGGADRYATAVTISKQLGTPAVIFEATGLSFQNALISGVAAAATNGVVVLTADGKMPTATKAYLDSQPGVERIAVGPQAGTADPSATKVAGASVYDTARQLAQRYFASPSTAAVASGTVFADALAGGAHIGRLGGPLLLSEPTRLPNPIAAYVSDNRATIDDAYLYGGPAALATGVEDELRSYLRQ